MKPLVTAFQRIGGPGSVTWAAFVLSLIDRVIGGGIQQVGVVQASLLVRLPYVLAAQVVMFVPLVLLALLQRFRPRSRPVLTLGAFLFAAVVRGWAYDALLHHFLGTPSAAAQRIFGSMYTVLLILVVCAYVANTLRERREEMTKLLAVRAQLKAARADAESSVQQRNEDLVEQVRGVLEREFASPFGAHPTEAVAALRRTAADVIRPLSHSLASSFAELEPQASLAPVGRLGWRDVVADAALDRPLRPVLTVLALSGTFISVAIVVPGAGLLFCLSAVVVVLVLGAGNVALRRLLPGRGSLTRLALVALACIVAGVATGAFTLVVVGPAAWTTRIAQGIVFYVAVVAAVIALVNGLLRARASLLLELSRSTEELRRQLVRIRQVDWFHQRALAGALHGPVQSAVEAAAYRLDDESAGGALSSEVVEGVRAELLRSLDVLNASEESVASLQAGMARIAATWEGLCHVDLEVQAEAASALEEDAVARSAVLNLLTEAVSNAVRHGKARRVSVLLRRAARDLTIVVNDDGTGHVTHSGRGLGTVFLDECTLNWSLSEDAPGHRLIATLPLESRSGGATEVP